MSLAKLHITEKSRKEWTCRSCGDKIPKGSRVIRFTVGFRGRPQERCSKTECYPKPSERESSMVSEVYAAQEEVDFNGAENLEDIKSCLQNVVEACESVCSQYEDNPMFDNNYDMQERVDMIRSAGEELENWEPDVEEPNEENWKDDYPDCVSFENAHDQWLQDAIEAAQGAVDEMELP